MMNKRWVVACLAIFITIPFGAARQQGTQDTPPPLAYSDWETDLQAYNVMDFASGEVTPIPRSENYVLEEFGGETIAPTEILLQSPHDDSLQALFIIESGEGAEGAEGYGLYLLTSDSERNRLVEFAYPATPLEWSPNGRYLYFYADRTEEGLFALYQYDLESGAVEAVLRYTVSGQISCRSETEWCVLRHPIGGDDKELYLLDTNTGLLRDIALVSRSARSVWWQEDIPAFIYAAPLEEERAAIHLYNYVEHMDTLIAELDEMPYVYDIIWSPEHRWLAVAGHEIVVITRDSADTEQSRITDQITMRIDPYSMRWVSAEKLYFEASQISEDGENQYGYYVADLSRGETRTAGFVAIEAGIIDDAWSPDGRWLALAFSNYGYVEANGLYIVDVLGETPMQEILTGIPPDHIICVGWYEPEVYASGEAYLCNIYMGIG